MKPIVICAALPLELKPLCQQLRVSLPDSERPDLHCVYKNIDLVLLVSGVGKHRMSNQLNQLTIDSARVWISVGYAGALIPELAIGDCVVGNRVWISPQKKNNCEHDVSNSQAKTDIHHRQNEAMVLQSSIDLNLPADGDLFCGDRLIDTKEQKQALYHRTGAIAVDMESAAVANHAMKRNEAFFFIKTISDRSCEDVSSEILENTLEGGFPSVMSALKFLCLHPHKMVELIRMGRRSRFCAEQLAARILYVVESIHERA